MFADKYENDPRILAVGPSAASTDFASIASAPIVRGKITHADTWAGRGGFGSKLFQDHGICAIIYGGTFIDEDFRDRKVADEWFKEKYNSTLAAKDLESTVKYRYDPKFTTGGTFGVNYATIGPRIMAFNYNTIYKTEEDRKTLHKNFILSHYLKQFNEETIEKKQQSTCGEPCAAVCKKLNGKFKKDYEPYQTLGPQSGIFDQRAAEKLNNYADQMGFDAINAGCLISWLFELLSKDIFTSEELGISGKPYFNESDFDIEKHSMHNAELGIEILDSILNKTIDISEGPRKWARKIHRQKNIRILDHFVYNANGRRGWMTPNQYWTAGVLSPMAIMGKYYMVYDDKFYSPRELGRKCADRLKKELILDNLGVCRFHRGWAEEMLPEILDKIYGMKEEYFNSISILAGRINSRNASVYWESQKNIDFIYAFLKRRQSLECEKIIELDNWIKEFEKDKKEASLNFWFEIRKGIDESLRDFL
jgi:glyceraldehyde-3-phosphate dehydrogenase (ferredoxin)